MSKGSWFRRLRRFWLRLCGKRTLLITDRDGMISFVSCESEGKLVMDDG
ncbi:MAG: hypothetical protein OXG05_13875 [Gammaproteobacteria bacterium]|nr:hypothetical protein [Gammaproteobacteria bacterium]